VVRHAHRPLVLLAAIVGVSGVFSACFVNDTMCLVLTLVLEITTHLRRNSVPHLLDPQHAWLTLAMSSTLAGNLTVLGSVANLIVIQRARHQVRIGFGNTRA
jgi:Na+/H+ antiporter NhaD/arsenite permease-like protein